MRYIQRLDRFLRGLEKQGMPKYCEDCSTFSLCQRKKIEEHCNWYRQLGLWRAQQNGQDNSA